MDIKKLKELKAKSHGLEATVQVGKEGITDSLIEEIKKQLKKRKLIKVKFLKSAGERKKLVEEIVSETGAILVRSVGRVAVLFKK